MPQLSIRTKKVCHFSSHMQGCTCEAVVLRRCNTPTCRKIFAGCVDKVVPLWRHKPRTFHNLLHLQQKHGILIACKVATFALDDCCVAFCSWQPFACRQSWHRQTMIALPLRTLLAKSFVAFALVCHNGVGRNSLLRSAHKGFPCNSWASFYQMGFDLFALPHLHQNPLVERNLVSFAY